VPNKVHDTMVVTFCTSIINSHLITKLIYHELLLPDSKV
jgi:hypothetical protein